MKYVILDFNGTIVDDLDLCIEAMNDSIARYLDRGPLDKEEYYEKFGFPVKDYYERVGFDFDELDWEEVGRYWMDHYIAERKRCRLHEGIKDFLIANHEKGNRNIVLSASKIDDLIDHLKELDIYGY
ncbi:MAG: HAD hydrolase-like protein, partial [Erysipelotrichaceae bacterium]|nr:HAD hydrolase-like protein [Erysipelotrichaceae bacterium]